jgi:riboflavin kinase / FMN adenylyltransferase
MKIYESIEAFQKPGKAIVSMGAFDGVHLGHQQLLQRLRAYAQEVGGETVMVTFWPHPSRVLTPFPLAPTRLLTTSEEKVSILENLGIDHLIKIQFTKSFSQLSAKNFVQQVLVAQVGAKKLVIGYDHRFGKGRAGNLALLQAEGRRHDFTVEAMSPQTIDAVNISSTTIRQLLLEGDVEKAQAYLGYPYKIHCTLLRKAPDNNRNLHIRLVVSNSHKLIPADGCYTVQVVHQNSAEAGCLRIMRSNEVPTIELITPNFLSTTLQESSLCIRFEQNLRQFKVPNNQA